MLTDWLWPTFSLLGLGNINITNKLKCSPLAHLVTCVTCFSFQFSIIGCKFLPEKIHNCLIFNHKNKNKKRKTCELVFSRCSILSWYLYGSFFSWELPFWGKKSSCWRFTGKWSQSEKRSVAQYQYLCNVTYTCSLNLEYSK